VEVLAGIVMGIAALGVFSRATWSWRGAVSANAFSTLGVLVGLYATRNVGRAGIANFYYHRVVIVILVLTLVTLLTRCGRAAFGRRVA
jgi:hypothetical protein